MSQPLGDPVLCDGDPLCESRHIDFHFLIRSCDPKKWPPVFCNELCKLKPTCSLMSCLTLQPRLCSSWCGCDFWESSFDSSVNSAHRLLPLSFISSIADLLRATVVAKSEGRLACLSSTFAIAVSCRRTLTVKSAHRLSPLLSTLASPGGLQGSRWDPDLENSILTPFQNSHAS